MHTANKIWLTPHEVEQMYEISRACSDSSGVLETSRARPSARGGLACRGPRSTRTWPAGHGTRVTGSPEDVASCSGRLLLPNTTQVPNVVLDRWMASMTEAEIKVVLYVVRRTYGFRRTSDRISWRR